MCQDSWEPQRGVSVRGLPPLRSPFLGPVAEQVTAPASRWLYPPCGPDPGHTQEVALKQLCVWEVSTSEIPSCQAPSPGWASRRGRRQMSGRGRGRPASPTHTGCHLGSRRGAGRAPETRLRPGQPLAWASSQSGGWGLGRQSCP